MTLKCNSARHFDESKNNIFNEDLHDKDPSVFYILGWTFKTIAMKIISLSQVEKNEVRMDGAYKAWKQVPLSREDGAPVYAYRVFTLEPGGHTPYHQHPYEHMNYIIQGTGALVNVYGEEQPIEAGDFALVLPDEKHRYKNKGDLPLILICGVPKEFE